MHGILREWVARLEAQGLYPDIRGWSEIAYYVRDFAKVRGLKGVKKECEFLYRCMGHCGFTSKKILKIFDAVQKIHEVKNLDEEIFEKGKSKIEKFAKSA